MLSLFKQHKEDFKIIFAVLDLEKCFRSKDKHFLSCSNLVTALGFLQFFPFFAFFLSFFCVALTICCS